MSKSKKIVVSRGPSARTQDTGSRAGGPGYAGVTEPVVACAFLGVAEHRVRLGCRLEALFGCRVPVIAVWMVLQRQLPVGALDV